MDLASIIGLGVCVAMMLIGIMTGDDGVAGIKYFFDFKSLLITYGGAFFAVLASMNLKDYIGGLKSFLLIFKSPSQDVPGMITKIIELSNVARKEGLLALEEVSGELDDAFMKKGILLIVDGTDPELVRAILETELASTEDRHKKNINFWSDLGAMGPAWGMIGTLIGLVLMLQNLSDAAKIGPSMAVALITTFYGSLLANWICTPTSNKLKANNATEIMCKEIMIEGLLSIQAGENPRVIEEKLKSFLAPADRSAASSEEGGEENG
ncbi:MAG: motility protein A [Butyrivibrio sp.]|nr:motility protein A [Butyrivibrio sp.]MBQ4274923.1 motility protein A [Lachnospiraceae bacterium]